MKYIFVVVCFYLFSNTTDTSAIDPPSCEKSISESKHISIK